MNTTKTTRKTILKGILACALLCAGFAPKAAQAAMVTASTSNTSYIQVRRGAVAGATQYRLFRNTVNNKSSAKLIWTGTAAGVNDWTASLGYKYYYWLGYKKGGKWYYFTSPAAGYRKMTLKLLLGTSGSKLFVGGTVNGTALSSLNISWSLSKSGVGKWTKYRYGSYLGYFTSSSKGTMKFTLKVGSTVALAISKSVAWR